MKKIIFFAATAFLFFKVNAQTGNVGIGTTLPKARLHVADSSVVFASTFDPLTYTAGNPPISGTGTRMMWYADKGAFRAGHVWGNHWDKDSIGLYSFASGRNAVASGFASIAMGDLVYARGGEAVAIGSDASANGNSDIAIGNRVTTGTSLGSIAIGYINEALAGNAVAIGRENVITSISSSSLAIGNNNIVNSIFKSAAIGSNNITTNGRVFGNNIISKFGGIVLGQYNDSTVSSVILQVGNGSSEATRKNALTIKTSGNTGINISNPAVLLHQQNGDSAATYHKFTSGTETGTTANDGFDIGITANGNAEIRQRENKHLFFYTNSTLKLKIDSAGNTGIGTSSPLARLHVADSNVLFSAIDLPPASPGNPPQSGEGRRMMWYADKAAFRAGYVINDFWNKDSVGNYSFAAGFNLKAKGIASAAFNYQSQALGDYSTALGNSIARGTQSLAGGFITNANGAYSSSFGLQTYANGYSSFAVGQYNDSAVTRQPNAISQTPETPLFIVGNGADASSRNNAMVVNVNGNTGLGTNIPAARLHVADSNVVFTAPGIATGTANPPVNGEGRKMMWYADMGAFRAGYTFGNEWSRNNTGFYSVSTGAGSIASGNHSVSMGLYTNADGSQSVALNAHTTALGEASLATGRQTTASGNYSFSTGYFTKSKSYGGTVVGVFNDSVNAASGTSISTNNRIFQIGNGTADNARNNAMTVLQNGNAGMNTTTPEVNMDINGDLAYRQNVITLVNGLNSNIDPGKYSFVKITGPNINFSIDGIQGGVDGKILTLFNLTGSNMLIVDQSGSVSNAANRINTLEGGVSISTINNGSVTLQYSAADNRWMVIGFKQ